MGLAEYIEKADNLSELTCLKSKKKWRYVSVIGGLLSLAAYTGVFVYAGGMFKQYLQFNIVSYIERSGITTEEDLLMDPWKSEILPIIDQNIKNPYPNFGAFHIVVRFRHNLKGTRRKYISLNSEMVQCSKLSNSEFYETYGYANNATSTINHTRSLCVNKTDIDTRFRENDEIYGLEKKIYRLNVEVWPCDPELKSECRELNESNRNQILDRSDLQFNFLRHSLDFTDKEPFKKVAFSKELFHPSVEASKGITYSTKKFEIKDEIDFASARGKQTQSFLYSLESGIRKEQNFVNKVPQLSCTLEQRENKSCNAYYSLNIFGPSFGKPKTIVTRKYMNFFGVVAQIGGFYSALWGVLSFLYRMVFKVILEKDNHKLAARVFKAGRPKTVCCRKRTQTENLEVEKSFAARELVDEALDVRSVIRQYCVLKALLSLVLNDQDRSLAIDCTLAQSMAQIRKQKEEKKKKTTNKIEDASHDQDKNSIDYSADQSREISFGVDIDTGLIQKSELDPGLETMKENDVLDKLRLDAQSRLASYLKRVSEEMEVEFASQPKT